MEKGPVSMNLVARVKAHPFYDQRPMVKELLESIIAAQPKAVQKQASKIIQQQSQDIVRRQISNHNIDKKLPDIVPVQQKASPKPGPPQIGPHPTTVVNKYQVQELPTKIDLKSIHKPLLESRPWNSVEVGFLRRLYFSLLSVHVDLSVKFELCCLKSSVQCFLFLVS